MNRPNQIVQKDTLTAMAAMSGFRSGLAGIERIMKIQSFDDIERLILKGSGLAASTYKVYLSNIRLFYEWSAGLHPLQIDPGIIEAFFDWSYETASPVTAHNRPCGTGY